MGFLTFPALQRRLARLCLELGPERDVAAIGTVLGPQPSFRNPFVQQAGGLLHLYGPDAADRASHYIDSI